MIPSRRCDFGRLLTEELVLAQQAVSLHHEHAIQLVTQWIRSETCGDEHAEAESACVTNLELASLPVQVPTGIGKLKSDPSRDRDYCPLDTPPWPSKPCPLPLALLTGGAKTHRDARLECTRSPHDPPPWPSELFAKDTTLGNSAAFTHGFSAASSANLVPSTNMSQYRSMPIGLNSIIETPSFESGFLPSNAHMLSLLHDKQKGDGFTQWTSPCADAEHIIQPEDTRIATLSETAEVNNQETIEHEPLSPDTTHSRRTSRAMKTSILSLASKKAITDKPGIISNAEVLKSKIRLVLDKPAYNVYDLYKKNGIWQSIARSSWFENLTVAVIALNAFWIAIDTDMNDSPILFLAEIPFQVVEQLFCVYFAFEWLTRWLAFASKLDGLRDSWFIFDSMLVATMVFETWLLSTFMYLSSSTSSGAGMSDTYILRIGRLVRLSRMARMARVLRVISELVVLVKGMLASSRSVLTTLFLLLIITYMSGIAFKQLTSGSDIGDEQFPTVLRSMYTLLLYGVLCLDYVEGLAARLMDASSVAASLFFLYILLACFTVMNMLIGVLCEVVSTVAASEKEAMALHYAKSRLFEIIKKVDLDGNMLISEREFVTLLEDPESCLVLHDVGIDVEGLIEVADVIFEQYDNELPVELEIPELMQILLQLRVSSTVTLKDIVELRRMIVAIPAELKTMLSQQSMDKAVSLSSR